MTTTEVCSLGSLFLSGITIAYAWVCAERSIISPDSLCAICRLQSPTCSETLLKAAKPGRLPSWTLASTHTQAAGPRTRRSHEGLWTRERMALKRLGLLNILCKNHVWLWNVYTVLLLFLKRMFMLMRRAKLLPKCHNTCALKKKQKQTMTY